MLKLMQLDDEDFVKKVHEIDVKSWDDHQTFRDEAEEDFNFVANHQWDAEDLDKLDEEKRPVITYNFCNAIVSIVLGMEANQRQEVTYHPRENSDAMISDALTESGRWINDYGDIEPENASVFENMLTCGMGWSEGRMDYETDLDGKYIKECLPSLEMNWDSTARKRNLKDSRWRGRRRKMPIDEIRMRWPRADLMLDEEMLADISEKSGILTFVDPETRYEDEEAGGRTTAQKAMPLVKQFQWYELEPVYRVGWEGRIVEMEESKFTRLQPYMDSKGIPYLKQHRRKYYQAFVAGKTLLERKELPAQSGFTLKCVTGKRDQINKQFYGLVRLMKDPQRWANKFFSMMLDILQSNSKGGVLIESDAVDDIRDVETKWAKTDSIISVKPGAISGNKILPKPVATWNSAVDRLLQFSIESIYKVTGVNLDVLGMVDRTEVGMVVESRKRSAYTILAPYFDSLRHYYRESGVMLLEYMIKYIPLSRIVEVLEPDLKPLAPQIKQLDMKQINIVVSESPQSDNNKMLAWSFLGQVIPFATSMGLPVPPEVLEYSPLPSTLIEKWKNLLAKSSEPSPEQQLALERLVKEVEQMSAETENIDADTMKKQMDTVLSRAKAIAEMSKGDKASAEAIQKHVETLAGENIYGG